VNDALIAHDGQASMLIRKPAATVFAAIVDPATTAKFWFSKGSGPLVKGQRVRWDWEMYGVHADVEVVDVEADRRVLVRWAGSGQPATTVEWTLAPRRQGTLMAVTQSGFGGSQDEIARQALNSTGGFAFYLAGMKAWLEHGVALGLTGDHHPAD
jgi:uncharacterized protein YndB with AHSA1/START domain